MAMPAEEYESDSDEEFIVNPTDHALKPPIRTSFASNKSSEKPSSQPIPVSRKPSSRIPMAVPVTNGVNVEDFRMAVIRGNVASTKECIEKGVEVNTKFKTGWTALMYASHYCNTNLVSLLLSHDATVTSEPKTLTPLMTACISNIPREDDVVECARLLVNAGADVAAIDQYEMTSLMMACKKNHSGVVQFLLANGAHVNIQDRQGWSALCYACNSGNVETVKSLLNKEADTSVQTLRGQTPLTLASTHTQVVTYLRTLPQFASGATNGYGEVQPEKSAVPDPITSYPSAQSPSKPTELRNGLGGFSGARASSSSPWGDAINHSRTPNTSYGREKLPVATNQQLSTRKADGLQSQERVITDYGDLEMFLFGLELPQLIPLFNEHNVNFAHLLSITDEELIKIGVNSVGWRKKILDNVTEVHKKDWKTSSIPAYDKVQAGKDIGCSETIAIVANLGSHTSYMTATVKFVQSQVKKHPTLLQSDKSGQSVHALRKFLHELEGNCKSMSESCRQLRTEVEQTLNTEGEASADRIARSATEKSGSRKMVYVLSGIALISIVCGLTASSRWAKLPWLDSVKFWNK